MEYVPYVCPWAAHFLLIGHFSTACNRHQGSKSLYSSFSLPECDSNHSRYPAIDYIHNSQLDNRISLGLLWPRDFVELYCTIQPWRPIPTRNDCHKSYPQLATKVTAAYRNGNHIPKTETAAKKWAYPIPEVKLRPARKRAPWPAGDVLQPRPERAGHCRNPKSSPWAAAYRTALPPSPRTAARPRPAPVPSLAQAPPQPPQPCP